MTQFIKLFLETVKKSLFSRQQLFFENLALRHLLIVYQRNNQKLKLKYNDRAIWVIVSRFLKNGKCIGICQAQSRNY